jgi:hypothetical protein
LFNLAEQQAVISMSNKVAALLPPPPIGGGLDKLLCYVDSFVRNSAQPLISLSPFIIPVLIAMALKLTRLFGPLAAMVAVLPLIGALFNAENVLRERSLLPPPDHKLKGGSKGTAVSPRRVFSLLCEHFRRSFKHTVCCLRLLVCSLDVDACQELVCFLAVRRLVMFAAA